MIVVLAASFVFGWFALLPDEFKQLGKHMAAGAGFVQNFVLWKEAGYFDTASELKPLMHLWSLAIEEQFYLAYPLLIWAAWRLGLNILTTVFLLSLLSFGLNVSGIGKDAVLTFFVPQTRFWELLAGAVLAYFQLFKRAQFADWLKYWLFHPVLFRNPPLSIRRELVLSNAFSALGLLLLLASVISIHEGRLFPGWWALAPVAGAFLLILAGPDAWGNRKILANKPMVFIGLISYPLYLWHWPILSFAQIVESEIPSEETRMVAVAISFLLAWLTYRFIEKPIRFGRKNWVKTAVLTVLLTLVGYVGYNVFERDGLSFRFPKVIGELATYRYDYRVGYREGTCFLRPEQDYKEFGACDDSSVAKGQTILLWGDSHAAHLYPGFKLNYGTLYKIRQRTASGCPPILDMRIESRPHCESINKYIYDELNKNKPDRIVLAANWGDHEWKQIERTILALRKIGISRIDLIGPVPQWKDGLPKQLLSQIRQDADLVHVPYRMESRLSEGVLQLDSLMSIYSRKTLGVNYISATKILCNNSGCLTRLGETGDTLTAWDQAHLTAAGSVFLVSEFPKN